MNATEGSASKGNFATRLGSFRVVDHPGVHAGLWTLVRLFRSTFLAVVTPETGRAIQELGPEVRKTLV
jgi:hypothetical protein